MEWVQGAYLEHERIVRMDTSTRLKTRYGCMTTNIEDVVPVIGDVLDSRKRN